MRVKRLIELLLLGLASHSGCIVACFGVGVLGIQPACEKVVEAGYPLAYLLSQGTHLLVALSAARLYMNIENQTYRIPLVVMLSGLLWVPEAGSYAAFALQAIFIFQMVGLLLGPRLARSGFAFRSCCCKSR